MVDVLNDQEWKQYKAVVIYIFDRYNPFPIPKLNLFAFAVSINIYNHYTIIDDAHYKVSLIEVIEVAVLNAVFNAYIGYKPKPRVYKLWIFVEDPLEIVRTR